LKAEIEKLKTASANDKTEMDKLRESKKDLTLKMAQTAKDNLLKKKEEEKAKKTIQDELAKALD
jgi:hypothetical protein